MSEPTAAIARQIIETVGGPGEPPEYGFQFFTSGVDPYLSVIDEEYLGTFVKQGGAAFKMVVGVYGGGKTHFLYCVRDKAWRHNFVVSYVSLKQGESPFYRLDLVYKAIIGGIVPPLTPKELLSGYEQGIGAFLKAWVAERWAALEREGLSGEALHEALLGQVEAPRVESLSFAKAVRSAVRALFRQENDEFDTICQWLDGEGYDRRVHSKYGILQKLDKTTAFPLLRSLAQWIRGMGFSGLVVLLDEAERVPSLSTKQREQHLSNLREVIDECGHTSFQGVMIFYAVPDENFLEGRAQVYEALKQRVSTVFADLNPTGVKLELENLISDPIAFLEEVGRGLAKVYATAYGQALDSKHRDETIRRVAEHAYEQRYGDIGYKRLFVQSLVRGLHYLRRRRVPPKPEDLK